MSLFDTYIMVDWSGGNDAGPTPRKDAIWACIARGGVTETPVYLRNREVAETWLTEMIADEIGAGRRVCAGFDFPFGYPRGFGAALTGSNDPLALWDWFADHIEDAPEGNNRCQVASDINALLEGVGPYWGNPYPTRDFAHLPRKGLARSNRDFPEKRAVEELAKGSFTCWQLSGAGAVGSQVMMGLPVLARLRHRFSGQVAAWPFEVLDRPVALVEIWPSLIAGAVARDMRAGEIKDAAQVRVLAGAVARLDAKGALEPLLRAGTAGDREGWILGVGFEAQLERAATGEVYA
ncbi:molybdopterin guanine dinucleotide synthesis [uncultured Litoreibacter sp.]|uniref:molybdopterin guanine dinucleotide synthesis n=1 Tax=uncultured Litoreibacter sp. TaxID=1392394 RepID=UPI0034592C9A